MVDNIQVAFASDANMVGPARVALGSTLEKASRAVTVHFLGYELTESDIKGLSALCDRFDATLVYHPLTSEMFDGGTQKDPNISLTTLGRMYLPRLVTGRVLYLDCDMLIRGDVADIFDIDLGQASLGVVRDFFVLHQIFKKGREAERLVTHRAVMGDAPLEDYFNAGLVLMDCDRISADPALCDAMIDMEQASQYKLLDQDYLNVLFKNKTVFLAQGWNSVWGRNKFHRRVLEQVDFISDDEKRPIDARIVHYTGPHKPWKDIRTSTIFRKRLPAVLKYRFAARRFRA